MPLPFSAIREVFLDLDGTIYRGSTLFPTSGPFLEFLRKRGIGYAFLSNNSSCDPEELAERLTRLGIRSEAEEFYLSTDYAIDFLKREHPEIRRIFPLGTPCLERRFERGGFRIDREDPQAVIVGFDSLLTYETLCRAAWFLRKGVPGFATHPDAYCPTDRSTWLVDCGAITACLECATGKKLRVLGKPDPGMLREAAKRRGVAPEVCLMIGDRLSTDIALGSNAGAKTCWIATAGEEADLRGQKEIHPDLTVADLGELETLWARTDPEADDSADFSGLSRSGKGEKAV